MQAKVNRVICHTRERVRVRHCRALASILEALNFRLPHATRFGPLPSGISNLLTLDLCALAEETKFIRQAVIQPGDSAGRYQCQHQEDHQPDDIVIGAIQHPLSFR